MIPIPSLDFILRARPGLLLGLVSPFIDTQPDSHANLWKLSFPVEMLDSQRIKTFLSPSSICVLLRTKERIGNRTNTSKPFRAVDVELLSSSGEVMLLTLTQDHNEPKPMSHCQYATLGLFEVPEIR